MNDSAKREVYELHQFFQQWFNGELPQTTDSLARFADVLADSFVIVSPTGACHHRTAIVQAVRDNWNAGEDNRYEIEIRNFQERVTVGHTMLVMYEEWQRRGQREWQGRVSSAWFVAANDKPNGLKWLHVHETMLPQRASP